jgi:hypothetical protein
VRTPTVPLLGAILAALAVAAGTVGLTVSAFSSPTSSAGSTFATATSFGGSCTHMSTPQWINGMEHQTTQTPDVFTSSLGGGITDTTVAHTGAASLKLTKSGSISSIRKSTTGNTQVLHFALRISSTPTGDVTLASLDSAVGADLRIRYQASSQKLALQWNTETPVEALSAVTPGTWYSIDLKASTATSPLTAAWRIDGVDQPGASSTAAATSHGNFIYGTATSETPTYVIHFDDIVYTRTLSDYPLGDVRIRALRPSGMGTSSDAAAFRNNDDTAITADSWMRVDDASVFGGTDYVKQVAANTAGYLEFGFEDPAETCIQAVQAYASSGVLGSANSNSLKSSVFDGGTERVIYSGLASCGNCTMPKNAIVAPASAPWTQSAVNGLVMRTGYAPAGSPSPYWGVLMMEYATK